MSDTCSDSYATVGRPPKYKAPEDMQEVIDLYFKTDAFIDMGGDTVYAPTISGLAFALGMSTEALRNYEQKDEFLATVKKAKSRVEIALEQKLYGNNVTGTIFNLKNNFNWKDKTDHALTAPEGPITQVERVIVKKSND